MRFTKLRSKVDLGALDITSYRDDLSSTKKSVINDTDIPFSLIGKVVLVDDVIYTGRTARLPWMQ